MLKGRQPQITQVVLVNVFADTEIIGFSGLCYDYFE